MRFREAVYPRWQSLGVSVRSNPGFSERTALGALPYRERPRGRRERSLPTRIGPSYLFTASLRRLPGEKRGRFAALIFIGAPVCG